MNSTGRPAIQEGTVVFRNGKVALLVPAFGLVSLSVVTWMLWPYLQESLTYIWSYLLIAPVMLPALLHARSRVVIDESQVLVVNPFSSLRVPLDSIERVESGNAPGWGMTGFLCLSNGRRVRLFAFECGWGWSCVEMKQRVERLNRLVSSRAALRST